MDENAMGMTQHVEWAACPACGRTLELELQLALRGGSLYSWFEGDCTDCCHKVVDPLSRADFDTLQMVGRIALN